MRLGVDADGEVGSCEDGRVIVLSLTVVEPSAGTTRLDVPPLELLF